MLGQSRILKFVGCLGSYRNLLAGRVAPGVQQQSSSLRTDGKAKAEKVDVPEGPKRPLTPFFRFLADQRQLVQKQHPDWKVIEITKQCAENWKKASEDLKKRYKQEYNENLELFIQKQQDFQESLTEDQRKAIVLTKQKEKLSKKRRKMRKRYRETGKPKRPTGSFIYFIKEKQALPENSHLKLLEVISKYRDEWWELSEGAKEKYINMNKGDKDRYHKEMLEWEAKMVKEGNLDVVRKESKSLLPPNAQQKVKASSKAHAKLDENKKVLLPPPIPLSTKKAQGKNPKKSHSDPTDA